MEPRIVALGALSMQEYGAFSAQPTLTQGDGTITWAILQAPVGVRRSGGGGGGGVVGVACGGVLRVDSVCGALCCALCVRCACVVCGVCACAVRHVHQRGERLPL